MTAAELTSTRRSDLPANEWWIVLLLGISSVIVGILLITDPGATLVTLVIFLGIYWFITGIFEIIQVFLDKSNWGWHLLSGVLGILAGLVVVRHPLWASLLIPSTLVWLLGVIGIIIGLVSLFLAFRGGGWGAGISGVISIVLGILLLGVSPFVATTVVVYLAAIWAIVAGAAAIIYAFRLRSV
jgi:uncharacterized membrane protein HdeD (DUF308 family)